MNQLARVAVRSGIDLGYQMLAVRGGMPGLIEGNFDDVSWADVEGMAHTGGADFGTRRYVPSESELYSMARQLEDHRVDALLVMGIPCLRVGRPDGTGTSTLSRFQHPGGGGAGEY